MFTDLTVMFLLSVGMQFYYSFFILPLLFFSCKNVPILALITFYTSFLYEISFPEVLECVLTFLMSQTSLYFCYLYYEKTWRHSVRLLGYVPAPYIKLLLLFLHSPFNVILIQFLEVFSKPILSWNYSLTIQTPSDLMADSLLSSNLFRQNPPKFQILFSI